jgi:hypothetical protein
MVNLMLENMSRVDPNPIHFKYGIRIGYGEF